MDRHSIDDLHELHWLPIRSRVTYTTALTFYRAQRLGRPPYLETMLHRYATLRSLRSSDSGLPLMLASKTKTAVLAFRPLLRKFGTLYYRRFAIQGQTAYSSRIQRLTYSANILTDRSRHLLSHGGSLLLSTKYSAFAN